MGSAADWHAFLDEFRSYGGKAENVMQRKGAFGLGLFPIDPSRPVELLVPDELLVATDNVELREGEVVIKNANDFPSGYEDWFRRYQSNYSWGAEGREHTLFFENGLRNLPEKILVLLKRFGLYNPENRFPGQNEDQELLQRFIQTRCINRKGNRVIMPIIDLLNHSPSAKAYDMQDGGIAVGGLHDGEVLVKYSNSDPIRRLIGYGFNVQETLGFSLSLRLQHRQLQIMVQGGGGRQPMQPCKIVTKDDQIILQQPLLASNTRPKLPRTLLIKATQNIDGIDANELFDQLHLRNTQAFVQLLRELQGVDSDIAELLREGCLNQILALSHHYGQRDDILNQEVTNNSNA